MNERSTATIHLHHFVCSQASHWAHARCSCVRIDLNHSIAGATKLVFSVTSLDCSGDLQITGADGTASRESSQRTVSTGIWPRCGHNYTAVLLTAPRCCPALCAAGALAVAVS